MDLDYKQLFESVQDLDNISKLAYDNAINQLESRIADVWSYICEKSNERYFLIENFLTWSKKRNWNFNKESVFINENHAEPFYININHFMIEVNHYYAYSNGFPAELLWDESWKATINNHVAEVIQKLADERAIKLAKNKLKRDAKREREKEITKLIPGIKDKIKLALTAEEHEIFLRKWQRKGY